MLLAVLFVFFFVASIFGGPISGCGRWIRPVARTQGREGGSLDVGSWGRARHWMLPLGEGGSLDVGSWGKGAGHWMSPLGEGAGSLDVVAVVVRAVGLGHVHLAHGLAHVVDAVPARRHALVDAVQALSLREAVDLVLGREASDGWGGEGGGRREEGRVGGGRRESDGERERKIGRASCRERVSSPV